MKKYSDFSSKIYFVLIRLCTILTFSSVFFIVAFILKNGIPYLNFEMFSYKYTTENVSMFPAIVTTLIMVVLSILIAGPIGIFTGFYLVEYAPKGSKVVEVIRLSAETLSGIPSIVYGLFGMIFFGQTLGYGYSILSGTLTVSIMILPSIIRSTEEALLSVSDSLRNASFALGAGKLRTIFRVVVPSAMPGILAGIILAIGRVFGETAALLYTLGTSTNMPKDIFSSGRTLALHMYVLSTEALNVGEAYATAVVLLIVVILINQASTALSNKLTEVK